MTVWPALGGPLAVQRRSVALYWEAERPVPPLIMASLQNEVALILDPSGMELDWRALASTANSAAATDLAVVKFLGRCDAGGLRTTAPSTPGRLGWTHVNGVVVLHFSDVDCGQVRGFLEPGLARLLPGGREAAFGRALGRVLAHELVHIFAQTARHGSGVCQAAFTVDDLLVSRPRLEKRDSAALVAH